MASQITIITLLIAIAVVCNILLPGVFWNTGLFWRTRDVMQSAAFAACGALVAEVCLLGIWCGMARQALKHRLPMTMALVLVASVTYCIGLQLPDRDQPRGGMPLQVALLICGAAFSQFFLMQIPLWIVRRTYKGQIVSARDVFTEESLQSKQFSVRYLMLWTAIVAVLLVVVRSTLPKSASGSVPLRDLIDIGTAILVYVGLSCMLTIPCAWIVLSESVHAGSMLFVLLTFTISPFVTLGLITMIFGRQDGDEFLRLFVCFEAGLVGTTGFALLMLRCVGYRMQSGPALQQS